MTTSSESPSWLDGDKIDEVLFCEELRAEHPMLSIHEVFFTVDGKVTDEGWIKNAIFEKLKPYVRRGLSRKIVSLLDTLRACCYSSPLPIYHDRIHVANGTLFLDGRFEASKDFCLNRLPVRYDPEAPFPAKWIAFLKSRVGIVLSALLGTNMYNGSIAKVETSPFARADLEYGLLLVDDDMKMEALPQTNIIKSLVTAEMPMDLEKKGKQSYQGTMYVRLLGFGNGTLKSLYDRSVGFFRRQIILTVKDRPKDRVDDPFLSEKLCGEIEGILLWTLEGLHRLQANDYRFTISARSRENMQESMTESNNVIEFLKSEGYIGFKADLDISSQRLYELYVLWCEENAEKPLSTRSFCLQMAALAAEYNLEPTNKVHAHGRQVRGYVGIYSLL